MATVKPLAWSEPRPPTNEFPASHYDNVYADTPFGRIMIEWKSWKDDGDSYDVMLPWKELMGNIWVGCHASEFTLEKAKQKAQEDFAKRVSECLERKQGDPRQNVEIGTVGNPRPKPERDGAI